MYDSRKIIVLQADAFCYGPASIALAICNRLRHIAPEPKPRLLGLGRGTCWELFSSSGIFDRCYALDFAPGSAYPAPVGDLLRAADAVVSVVDFEFAKRLSQMGLTPVFVDPLYWMWDEDPLPVGLCRTYFALDFPGVSERIGQLSAVPDYVAPTVVGGVRDRVSLEQVRAATDPGLVLVNFGGLHSPLGMNTDLAHAVARNVVRAALDLGRSVLVCGGRAGLRAIGLLDARARLASLPQAEFFQALACCGAYLTSSGLSSFQEALHFAKPTLFLPPLNYSQSLQSEVYKQLLQDPWVVTFGDFPGYAPLEPGLPEAEGVARVLEQGRRFAADPAAQTRLREMVWAFLGQSTPSGLRLRACQRPPVTTDGTRPIAEAIVALCYGEPRYGH